MRSAPSTPPTTPPTMGPTLLYFVVVEEEAAALSLGEADV